MNSQANRLRGVLWNDGLANMEKQMQGRIKLGAPVFQDHHFGKWPACCPPGCSQTGKYEADDPDMVFDIEWNGHHWECKADGFGMLRSRGEAGDYGNGSIFVRDHDGVELLANAEVRGEGKRSLPESSAEGATSTDVLEGDNGGKR